MKRYLPYSLAVLLTAAACGPAELVVSAEVEVEDAAEGTVARPLGDLEVQLLPYDRDEVFDSLEAAFGTPEPVPPPDLLEAQSAVQEAQEAWRAAEERWNTLRDTLTKITEAMEQYNRGESRYVALYREFQDLDAEYAGLERQRDRLFQEFTTLQNAIIQRSDSMRIAIDQWADQAFADANDVFLAKMRESGLDAVADTTDASGVVRIEAAPGQYWVHARYELPYSELYWNVPVTLERGEPTTLQLTSENAEQRVKM